MPQVVQRLDIQPAQALLALSSNIALLTGPVAAGLLVAGVGAGGAIAVDALTFLVSAATLVRMRPTPGERARGGSFVKDLAGGWREVASRSWVWAILLGFSAYHALVLPALFVLGPLYAETNRGGATSWGVISAGFGIGSLVGSLVALRVRVDRTGLVIGAALAVSCSQAVIVVLPIPTLAVAALEAVTGITVALCFTLWETALNLRIPAAAQSRVSSFDYLASLTLMPIGYVVIGPVAEAVGTQRTALLRDDGRRHGLHRDDPRPRCSTAGRGVDVGQHTPTEEDLVIGFIITMLIVGAIAGFLARALVPGRDPMSIPMTIGLGIVGSLIGGFLGYLLFGKDGDEGALQPSGIIGSIVGAIIALLVYRATIGKEKYAAR